MKEFFFTTAIILFISIACFAQSGETLNNSSIIQLQQMGLGAQTVINKIRVTKTNFDVTIVELGNLKKANVPDEVIAEMISVSDKQSTSNAAASEDTNDPASYHEPGIYYFDEQNHKMIKLEAALFNQETQGSSFLSAYTYGAASVKTKSIISGAHSNLQIKNPYPIFYFYFEKSNNSLSNSTYAWDAGATSPNEFILLKFNITKSSREVTTGSWNAWVGNETGIEDKNKASYKYEKIATGVYKVTINDYLKPWEYGFIYSGGSQQSQSSKKVFDFGTE